MISIIRETAILLRLIREDRPARFAAVFLFCSVILLVAIYAVSARYASESGFAEAIRSEIRLSSDQSVGEAIGYSISAISCAAFFIAYLEVGSLVLVFLSVFMAFVWFDDVASYHERVGIKLAEAYHLPTLFGLREQDFGELIAWSVAAALLLVFLIIALGRRRPGDAGVLACFAAIFALLFFCGVIADMLHIVWEEMGGLFGDILEDGGEMVALSLIAGLAIGLSRNVCDYYKEAAAEASEVGLESGD